MDEEIFAYIITKLKDSYSEPLPEMVLKRLVEFGYELKEIDAWPIYFAMQKVEHHIKNQCNITSIPDGLMHIAVDMVCGEFLFAKKQTGQLEFDAVNLDGAIKKVQEGDITVEFATGTSSSNEGSSFDKFIDYLIYGKESELVCYRKLMW